MNPTDTTPAASNPAEPITNMMSVSDINRRYPQCTPVFNKYGLGGCGGEFGPTEPLFIFAAAHRVPIKELVVELNQAVRGEWKDDTAASAPVGETPEEREQGETLYKRFIGGALFFALTSGTAWGVINLTRIALARDYAAIGGSLKQAHGHEQLFGWVGLFIMGMAFHAVPRFKMRPVRPLRLARACFALLAAGVLLRAVSQPLATHPAWGIAWIASAALELAGIAAFAWLITQVMIRSDQPVEFFEKYIWASIGWLVVLGVWNLVLAARMFGFHSNTISALPDALFVHVALFGFIGNMIFGFSFRVLSHFLGLRDAKIWAANVAFVLWNMAIFFRYPLTWMAWTASVLELAAVVLLLWSLGIWARRRAKIEIQGVDSAFAWFIHLGFGWLLLAAALPFHGDIFRLTASSRHAIAIGFIVSMIMGVAYRVLPVFNGVNLHSKRALRISFVLFAAGSAIPVAMMFTERNESRWAFAWAAASGYLVLAAVAVFAWNIAMTLRTRAEPFTRESEVKLQTRIADLLDMWPDLRPVLIHSGLHVMTRLRGNPPRFVTLEFVARRHGIDPQPLIRLLNEEIRKKRSP